VVSKFIDSHAHLDDKIFETDRDNLISSLYDNDVEAVLNPGADLKSSKEAVLMANKYSFIYAAVGCHPHDTKYMSDEHMNKFKEMAKNKKVIGIGEIGLFFYYASNSTGYTLTCFLVLSFLSYLTFPSIMANSVSSLPLPTLTPG
jgi:Tat protein secretion system quality control protein TatD with DNase activity